MKNNKIVIAATVVALIVLAGGIWYLNKTGLFGGEGDKRSIAVGVTSKPASETERNTSTVSIIYLPEAVEKGKAFNIAWAVNAVGEVAETTRTGVYYDFVSHAGTFGTDIAPETSGYAFSTDDFDGKNHPIPQTFTIDYTPDRSGSLFVRALAVIDGKNYWTDEYTVAVKE